jgi:peroxiredoxin
LLNEETDLQGAGLGLVGPASGSGLAARRVAGACPAVDAAEQVIEARAPHRHREDGAVVPDLTVPLLAGGAFRLADRHPERFAMVVFYRGLHCPVCQAQLRELDRRLDELEERGIEVVAVSGETHQRTQRLRDEWKLKRLTLA